MKRVACALLLLALAVSFTLAGRAAQEASPLSGVTQNSTSLNGPGNVFLTANAFGSGGTTTLYVAVADINGDGKLDYVTANQGTNSIGVALGNGDGTFQAPIATSAAGNPVWVTVGDFNGDGHPDLAVVGTSGSLVSILLGKGDGTFTAGTSLTSPLVSPRSAVVGDFDGDGKLDLAVVDQGATDTVYFFFGNGNGTFTAPVAVNLGTVNGGPNAAVVADFNKDGHLDLAMTYINKAQVDVILGSSVSRTFQAPRTIALPSGQGGWGLAVGDFNGDGIPDLVATSPNIGGISVFLGTGNGNFTPVNNPQSGTLPTATGAVPGGGATTVAVGDFNGDGKLDVIVGLAGVNTAATVAVLLGNGDGTLQPELLFGVEDTPVSVAVGDFNGDGKLDWVAACSQINSASAGSVVLSLGRGDGTFRAARDYVAGQGPQWSAVTDFNKDGKLDVVTPNTGSQNISVFLGNGDGTLQPAVNIPFPALSPNIVVTGDFNNDGNPDFVVFSNWCPNFVNEPLFTYLGNGDGTFQTPVNSNISGLSSCGSMIFMVAGDFNGDGKLDLGLLLATNTGPVIAIMLGNGDGTFQAPKITQAPGGRATFMSVGDLNKDGKLDAVVAQYQDNLVQIFLGKGDGTFQSPTSLATGRGPGSSVLGDFNQDGKLDLFVESQFDQNAEIFLGVGDGTFLAPSIVNIQPTNSPASVKVIGDFNLDGHLDVLFTHNDNRGTGISLLLGNGDGTFQTVQNYLVSGFSYVVAVGDFNGDGAPDALLVDTNEEFISILLNQTPPPLSVSPNSLSYGTQIVGTTSATQPIAVKNNGTAATTIGVAVSGDFTQSNTCPVSPATLAGGASCAINAAFKPSATGVRNGAITVSSTLPGGMPTVTLTGTGLAATPVVTLSASSLSYNNQVVNTTSSPQTVTLTNSGGGALHLAATGAVVIGGTNPSDFTVASGTTCINAATVAPSASCIINVTFDPSATGARSATLTITDDASPATQTVSLTGTGTAPTVTLSPAPLNFGNQLTGATSSAMNITLTNTGTAPLHLAASNAMTIGGTNATDFAIVAGTTCANGATVNASGGTCVINITFTPGANGARSGSLSVSDDATPSPQTATLSGTGVFPAVTLSTASLSFANQRVGTTSATLTLTLTDSGTAPLHLAATNAVAVSGTNASDFAIASGTTCTNGATVNVNANCVINVTFTPSATGARGPATFTITDDAKPTTQTFTASGTGVFPLVQLSANTVNFGNQRTGVTSAAQTITVTNNGTDTLHLAASNAVALSGTNASDFAIVTASTTCTNGATVAPGANCVINITFAPAATGSSTATLMITDDANPTAQTVALTGTGVAPAATLSGTSLTFSGQLINTSSAAQPVTLTNGGTAPLTISSIAVTGANASEFSLTNTCPASSSTLAVGANCTISVTFKPTATGNRVASVTITDDAANSPQSVSLTGTGTDYSLAAATGSNCPTGGNCSTTATISSGQTAMYNLQVSPVNGFNGSVALTCLGAPGASTCSIAPAAVPSSGSSSYAFAVTVSNTTNALVPTSPVFPPNPWLPWMRLVLLLAMILTSLLVRGFFAATRPVRILVPVAAALFFSLVYVSGCGSAGGGPVVKPPTNATLTITGSSGTVNRTLNLSLTVNH